MKERDLPAVIRRHAVPVSLGLAFVLAALVFWRPLVAWFTGEAMGGGEADKVRASAGAITIDASLEPDPPREKGNTLHLHVADGAGAALAGARVAVDVAMPAMGAMQEMRATAEVSDRGGGHYTAGFDLPMNGTWTLSVRVTGGGDSGEARFTLTVGRSGLILAGGSGGSARKRPASPAPRPQPSAASGPPETAAPELPPRDLPAPALAALQNAFAAYEEVRALLARDRIDIARPAGILAREIRGAAALDKDAADVAKVLGQAASAADSLASARTLEDARRWFGEASRFLIAVGATDSRLQAGWHVFHCPMTKGFPRWFQKSQALENPYMGQSMPTCGSPAAWRPSAPTRAASMSHDGHGHDGDEVAFYTCSMHPSVERKQPGTCPICSMNLVPVTYDETESGVVRVDEARRQRIGVKTARVARAAMTRSIRAVGRLTYDETRLVDVTLKVKGWIASMRVNATGQPVRKGETLFALYSPELYAAQQEYLLALESQRGAGAGGRSDDLAAAAARKLRFWGMSEAQVAALARRGQATEEIAIPSPASGYVIEKDVVEGAAVEPGQRLYRIASLDKIWVEAQVYEHDLGQVQKGQKAEVTLPYRPGDPLQGTVAYVYPYLDPISRTGRVRIELPNKDLAFKPDMYANVHLQVELGPRLLVPIDAVVYTGPRRLVFVDLGEGRIRPQEVTLGARNAEAVEILSGLREGDIIVTSANFLIAAESRIRSAAELWSDEVGEKPRPGDEKDSHAGH